MSSDTKGSFHPFLIINKRLTEDIITAIEDYSHENKCRNKWAYEYKYNKSCLGIYTDTPIQYYYDIIHAIKIIQSILKPNNYLASINDLNNQYDWEDTILQAGSIIIKNNRIFVRKVKAITVSYDTYELLNDDEHKDISSVPIHWEEFEHEILNFNNNVPCYEP